jgi:hypothetical protein
MRIFGAVFEGVFGCWRAGLGFRWVIGLLSMLLHGERLFNLLSEMHELGCKAEMVVLAVYLKKKEA